MPTFSGALEENLEVWVETLESHLEETRFPVAFRSGFLLEHVGGIALRELRVEGFTHKSDWVDLIEMLSELYGKPAIPSPSTPVTTSPSKSAIPSPPTPVMTSSSKSAIPYPPTPVTTSPSKSAIPSPPTPVTTSPSKSAIPSPPTPVTTSPSISAIPSPSTPVTTSPSKHAIPPPSPTMSPQLRTTPAIPPPNKYKRFAVLSLLRMFKEKNLKYMEMLYLTDPEIRKISDFVNILADHESGSDSRFDDRDALASTNDTRPTSPSISVVPAIIPTTPVTRSTSPSISVVPAIIPTTPVTRSTSPSISVVPRLSPRPP